MQAYIQSGASQEKILGFAAPSNPIQYRMNMRKF